MHATTLSRIASISFANGGGLVRRPLRRRRSHGSPRVRRLVSKRCRPFSASRFPAAWPLAARLQWTTAPAARRRLATIPWRTAVPVDAGRRLRPLICSQLVGPYYNLSGSKCTQHSQSGFYHKDLQSLIGSSASRYCLDLGVSPSVLLPSPACWTKERCG